MPAPPEVNYPAHVEQLQTNNSTTHDADVIATALYHVAWEMQRLRNYFEQRERRALDRLQDAKPSNSN